MKLDEALLGRGLANVKLGEFPAPAFEVDEAVFEGWLLEGRNDLTAGRRETPCARVVVGVVRAEAECQRYWLRSALAQAGGPKPPSASLFLQLLKARFGERWDRRVVEKSLGARDEFKEIRKNVLHELGGGRAG